jgi:hypothetical protein
MRLIIKDKLDDANIQMYMHIFVCMHVRVNVGET